jgi:2-dehydro-3-deoxyphosphooctonate aldolase (KDO 8-P synthase)
MLPNIDQLNYTDSGNFLLIAGPCVIEGEEMAFQLAETIKKLSDKYHFHLYSKVHKRRQIDRN